MYTGIIDMIQFSRLCQIVSSADRPYPDKRAKYMCCIFGLCRSLAKTETFELFSYSTTLLYLSAMFLNFSEGCASVNNETGKIQSKQILPSSITLHSPIAFPSVQHRIMPKVYFLFELETSTSDAVCLYVQETCSISPFFFRWEIFFTKSYWHT